MKTQIITFNEDGSIVLPPDVRAAKEKRERKIQEKINLNETEIVI
jgi:hypothetical protein